MVVKKLWLIGLFVIAIAASSVAAPAIQARTQSPVQAAGMWYVCANDLYVREAPGGYPRGILEWGDGFNVDKYDSTGWWAHGVGHDYEPWGTTYVGGWVEARWLCR